MWKFKILQRDDGNNGKMDLEGNCMLVPIYNPLDLIKMILQRKNL